MAGRSPKAHRASARGAKSRQPRPGEARARLLPLLWAGCLQMRAATRARMQQGAACAATSLPVQRAMPPHPVPLFCALNQAVLVRMHMRVRLCARSVPCHSGEPAKGKRAILRIGGSGSLTRWNSITWRRPFLSWIVHDLRKPSHSLFAHTRGFCWAAAQDPQGKHVLHKPQAASRALVLAPRHRNLAHGFGAGL